MIQAVRPVSSSAGVSWDLGDLYSGVDDPRIADDLARARSRAQAFEAKYRGRIETLDGSRAPELAAALEELESLSEEMDRPAVFAGLVHAAKTDDPRHGALLTRVREERTAINKHLIFFDLEWVKVPDEAAKSLTNHPA